MKKYLLLLAFVSQINAVFCQKVIAEDEKVIQYDTEWGNWVATSDNANILFSAKLKWYDKQKRIYAWSVRHKVTRMPIAFEWKIANQVFTGASDYSGAVGENDGYYKSSTFDSRDNANSMNGSGFAIYSSSKTMLYYQVRNVCLVFDGRNPNCNSNANLAKSKTTNPTSLQQNDAVNNSAANNGNQTQQHNQVGATQNTNVNTRISKSQQQEEVINTVGTTFSNAAVSLANKNLASLVRQTEIEEEVKQILSGRESQYPEAAKHFDIYLKEKKKAKRGMWIGVGLAGAGAVVAGIGALSGGEYDINETLVYTGAGAAVVGLIKTVFSIPVSAKGTTALDKAKKSLTFGAASSGLGMSIKF